MKRPGYIGIYTKRAFEIPISREKRAYSGIFRFSVQDSSLRESMEPMQNHEAERLLPTDKGIVMARRMLHEAALDLSRGVEPPALDAGKQRVRAASVQLD